jgi:hypothetical protein
MKRPGFVLNFALFLLTLSLPQLASAQSSRGSYRFMYEDGLVKSVDFDAVTDLRGNTSGSMLFTDEASIPYSDDPDEPRDKDAPPSFYVKVDFNSMTVVKNRALMGGIVRDSSNPDYIGRWAQLVVEDNGDSLRVPDQLTWTICRRSQKLGWIPSDAERRDDDGAFLHWWATDAERDDDKGIPSPDLLGSGDDTGCIVYPLSQYAFATPLKWEGDLIVQP